ncbi:ATP-dependent helicase [Lysobacter sp. TY2-98]|uniref:UvrD-helicase domain-containing protein n=1 Tax=Lysobacter sp. TY2-98 TaxID=2290922 RepID=UPI000E209BCF|nr:UvrD-helicase domain-containing protein [Lysobacter sp. TY2-98]AXK72837.1 ATP-dependent helicase [Lysobacter sp. TY2-98]
MSVVLAELDAADDHVDAQIAGCLNLEAPRSFFLFAGAGSGKTRSLVTALEYIKTTLGGQLRSRGQRVAVITFTNAASDEIKRRLLFDPLIDVRTIHSFAWSLIDGLSNDIRTWLSVDLAADIDRLAAEEAKGRKGTKASNERLRKIASKTRRLNDLPNIKRFVYSPTSDNRGRDALNHSEVLRITADFLREKPAMQSILVGRYPILLIDESQDTNKDLVDSLFAVQAAQKKKFMLGLIGDMMQRIYSDGKDGLGESLPSDWMTSGKKLNYRCPRRVVTLINRIRSTADGQEQQAWSGATEGVVRLFLMPRDHADKAAAEAAVARRMAEIADDEMWRDPKSVKTLTLEHRMAAARMGFLEMFSPLYQVNSWRTSFLDGKLPILRFFSEQVLPIVNAKVGGDAFGLARLVKNYSPLISRNALRAAAGEGQLQAANAAVGQLVELCHSSQSPKLRDVLLCVAKSGLLEIPDALKGAIADAPTESPVGRENNDDPEDRQSEQAEAIQKFLDAPFSQVAPFSEYLGGQAHFDTHQGVKGLEFDRVMVVMDDAEARGFLFKYEDLFGGKTAGATVESTRRLFYVTCSRARRSLALVAYTSDVARVRDYVIGQDWFTNEEVVVGIPD